MPSAWPSLRALLAMSLNEPGPVGHAFEPTQPLPEHQDRLRRQQRWRRSPYVPNHLPLSTRLLAAWLAVAWSAWAVVAFVTGHFLVMIGGRRNAVVIDFDGWAAIAASLALLCIVAICVAWVVDHHDRRDNEAVYRRFRRAAAWSAGALLVAAVVVNCTGELGWGSPLPSSISASTGTLRSLTQPIPFELPWRGTDLLAPASLAFCFVPLLFSLALIKLVRPVPGSLLGVIAGAGVLPMFALSSLGLVNMVFGGHLDASINPSVAAWTESEWRKIVALAWSALVLVALFWGLLLLALIVVTIRAIRGEPLRPGPHSAI